MTSAVRHKALTPVGDRLLAALVEISRGVAPASVPVTPETWDLIQAQVQVAERVSDLWALLRDVADFEVRKPADAGGPLRRRAEALCGEAIELLLTLARLQVFRPPEPAATVFQDRVATVLISVKEIGDWLRAGAPVALPDVKPWPVGQTWTVGCSKHDPFEAVLGIPLQEVVDSRGRPDASRAFAHWRGNLGDLQSRMDSVLRPLTASGPTVFEALQELFDVLELRRPLMAWTVARRGYSLFASVARSNPTRVRAVCEELRERDERRAEVKASLGGPSGVHAEGPAAMESLNAYARVAEGNLRDYGWACLRLLGADGARPMLNEVKERLVATGDGELIALSDAIDVGARNAAAHVDTHFDHLSGMVDVGGRQFAPAQIHALLEEAIAVARGFELALACVRHDFLPAAEAYPVTPGDISSPSALLVLGRQRFGHAGLLVQDMFRDRSSVSVVLDELVPLKSNPCFLALCQAHRWVPRVERWVVSVVGRPGTVIDLPGEVLSATTPTYLRAEAGYASGLLSQGIPTATFLPSVTWSRLPVETPGQAVGAAAWLALNEAQHAIEDTEAGLASPPALIERLRLVILASNATLKLFPDTVAEPLLRSNALLRRILFAFSGRQLEDAIALASTVLAERDRHECPAPLPTLDSRSILELDGI